MMITKTKGNKMTIKAQLRKNVGNGMWAIFFTDLVDQAYNDFAFDRITSDQWKVMHHRLNKLLEAKLNQKQ